jgi:predicted nucleic acid-binding protein
MKFLDANPFIYAFYKPRRTLTSRERELKKNAKRILTRVLEDDEETLTTIVHLSEVVNVLKHGMKIEELRNLLLGLFSQRNLKVLGVSPEEYLTATELASELELDPNDALAVLAMRTHEVNEIYSFDSDFNRVEGVKTITE